MQWIVQGLSRFSYRLYQEGIITGKLQVQGSKINSKSCFAKFRSLGSHFTFGCTDSFCGKGLCKPSNKLEFEATFCSCSRTLRSHFLVQEVSPWYHSVFRDVHGTPQAWCRQDGSWDEMGSWCIRMGQWSSQAIFKKLFVLQIGRVKHYGHGPSCASWPISERMLPNLFNLLAERQPDEIDGFISGTGASFKIWSFGGDESLPQ